MSADRFCPLCDVDLGLHGVDSADDVTPRDCDNAARKEAILRAFPFGVRTIWPPMDFPGAYGGAGDVRDDTCGMCEHPHHDDECEETVGYDHINGDHECGCPGDVADLRDENERLILALDRVRALLTPPSPAKYDTEGNYEGRVAGTEHRTVGGRAWCPNCTEWCYPESYACPCCEPKIEPDEIRAALDDPGGTTPCPGEPPCYERLKHWHRIDSTGRFWTHPLDDSGRTTP